MNNEQLINISLDIVRIRDPAARERRSEIIRNLQNIKAEYEDIRGGQNRIMDRLTDTYGNGFCDFLDQPSDEPLSAQQQSELFVILCVEDSVRRMAENGSITADEAEMITWRLRTGLVASAARMALAAIRKGDRKEKRGEDRDGGSESRSGAEASSGSGRVSGKREDRRET